jgi:hypothetical protein
MWRRSELNWNILEQRGVIAGGHAQQDILRAYYNWWLRRVVEQLKFEG